jgi:hypothetical protein
MLTVACCLWDPNERSQDFSKCYDESWVEKLYRGFARNLTIPFRFVCFTDRERSFDGPVEQQRLATKVPHYGCLIEPFRLNEPTMICGLDMVVVRNIDQFAAYCLDADKPALVGHPTNKAKWGFINPIVFTPQGFGWLYDEWNGENDMDYLRRRPFNDAQDLWPGQLLSLKLNKVVLGSTPPPEARIIYMHGRQKPHELGNCGWIKQHWV